MPNSGILSATLNNVRIRLRSIQACEAAAVRLQTNIEYPAGPVKTHKIFGSRLNRAAMLSYLPDVSAEATALLRQRCWKRALKHRFSFAACSDAPRAGSAPIGAVRGRGGKDTIAILITQKLIDSTYSNANQADTLAGKIQRWMGTGGTHIRIHTYIHTYIIMDCWESTLWEPTVSGHRF